MDERNLSAAASIGRFALSDELGAGAFGKVHLATDSELNREVALKIPKEGTFQSEQEAERFVREARAAAGLQHPNICPVHDVLRHDGVPVIVMGYIKGSRLDEIIARKQFAPRKAAALVGKLAKTLQYAHEQGVIHRDLKPANIIINSDRKEPVIMDFGLARVGAAEDSELTRTGQVLGSPAYMSPEQANADLKAIGPQSDIYSLGIILYELLCGRRPFDGSVGEVLAAILYAEPEKPSAYRETVDAGLEEICLKAIAKERGDRYPDMNAFARDLSRWLRSSTPTDAPDLEVSPLESASLESPSVETLPNRKSGSGAKTTQSDSTRTPKKLWLGAGTAILLLAALTAAFFRPAATEGEVEQDGESLSRNNSLDTQREETPAVEETVDVAKPIRVELVGTRKIQSDPKRVSDLAIQPSGKFIAAANDDRTVKVWDVTTGELAKTLTGFQKEAICVAYSSDGATLVTGDSNDGKSQKGTVIGWDTESWEKSFSFTDTKAIRSLQFADDDQQLIVALGSSKDENQVRRMEGMRRGMGQRAGGAKFGPRAQQQRGGGQRDMWFKTWQWGGLIIWDVKSQTIVGYPSVNTSRLLEVSASSDGQVLATCGYRGELNIRDPEDGEVVSTFGEQLLDSQDYGVHAVRVSDDGSLMVAAVPGGVSLYSTTEKKELREIHTEADVRSLAISSDNRLIAVGLEKGPVTLWDAFTGNKLAEMSVSWNATSDLEFQADDRLLAASGGDVAGDILLWSINVTETADGGSVGATRFIEIPEDGASSEVSATDGVMPASSEVVAISADTQPVLSTTPFQLLPSWKSDSSRTDWIHKAFSPNGQLLATGNWDHSVKVWNPQTRELVKSLEGHSSGVCSVGWSSDGKRLCSSDWRGSIRVWNATSFELEKTLNFGRTAWCSGFTPDGKRLICGGGTGNTNSRQSGQGLLRIWNTSDWSLDATVPVDSAAIRGMAIPDDGGFVVTCGLMGELSLRNPETGEVTSEINDDSIGSTWVDNVAASSDGRWIAAGVEQMLILYEVESQSIRQRIRLPGKVLGLSFAADSRHLAVGVGGNPSMLFDVEKVQLLAKFPEGTRSRPVFSPADGNVVIRAAEKGFLAIVSFDQKTIGQ